MIKLPLIAVSADEAMRRTIAQGELFHVTRFDALDKIVTDAGTARPIIGPHEIHLRAGQAFSVFPFRLLRDYSVLDVPFAGGDFYGQYLYFFLGAPNWWDRFKNLGTIAFEARAQREWAVVRVSGAAVLAQAGQHVYYRVDDGAVVVRGEYRGPAMVGW